MDELANTPVVNPGRQWFSGSVRTKVILLTAGPAALVAVLLSLTFFVQMQGIMRDELKVRGRTVGIELANNLAFAAFSGDKVGLDSAAAAALRDVPDLAYVLIRNSKGEILSQLAQADLGRELAKDLPVPKIPEGDRFQDELINFYGETLEAVAAPMYIEDKGGDALADPLGLGGELIAPRHSEPGKRAKVGLVQVGFRLTSLQAKVSEALKRAIALALLMLVACATAAVLLARVITVPIERLSHAAVGIAAGHLNQEIHSEGSDEIAVLARSFSSMSGGLRLLIADLQAAAGEVQREANSILSTASQQAALASQQATAINETSATAVEIAATSQQATSFADSVIQVAQKSEEFAKEGQRIVEESVSGIEKLGEQVRAIAATITDLSERTLQIGDIIATVKDLAEKSNILALNASIEAAKAGEHGRGFAVVAMEMKSLADQSKAATNQVRAILGEVQKGTRAAVSATEEGSKRADAATTLARSAGSTIVGLADVSRESASAAKQIAVNTRQQTTGVEQIVSAISEQSRAMNEAVEGTRKIEDVAGNLSLLSKRLSELVSRYRV